MNVPCIPTPNLPSLSLFVIFISFLSQLYSNLMGLVVTLAELGLIHGDFNEFNLMVNEV
eukprot:m.102040 g.102040  ORF g.102040 m.102040 type:complete len:59 (+) comp9072_c0_seq6:803-979(+)